MEIRFRGARAYAYTAGHTVDSSRPGVMFLHGAGLDHSSWVLQSRYFGYHGMNVLAIDLPAHGFSEGEPLAAVGAMADWALEFAAVAGLDKLAVVGHSMGSLVALECAARAPERVSALAMLAVAFPMKVSTPFLDAARDDPPAAWAMHTIWGHSQGVALGADSNPGMSMQGESLARLRRLAPGVLHADLSACDRYEAGLEAAARVRCPALFLLGAQDVMTPPRGMQALGAKFAAVETKVMQRVGHALMAEAPDEVLDALIGFLPR
jgi:pimeloyl-ACP methyl ester carboxylesterase